MHRGLGEYSHGQGSHRFSLFLGGVKFNGGHINYLSFSINRVGNSLFCSFTLVALLKRATIEQNEQITLLTFLNTRAIGSL